MMHVRSLTLQRYGAFTGRSIPFGDAGMSLVVGVNEAGKSTALEGLSDLLWGIPTESGQAFLYGRPALALEACLELPGGEQIDVIRRSAGLTRLGNGAVVPGTWETASDSRRRWRQSFGLSHAELRAGGTLLCEGQGDLAELVFTARSGRVVRELLGELQGAADALYKPHRGAKAVAVRRAFADYEEARALADAASVSAHQVQAARAAVEQAARDVGQAHQRLTAARAAEARADRRQRAAGDARRLADVQAELSALRITRVALNSQQLEEWEQAQSQVATAGAAEIPLAEDLAARRAERSAVVVESEVLDDAEQIRRLHLEAEARSKDGERAGELLLDAQSQGRKATAVLADLVGEADPRPVPELLAALHVAADRVTMLDRLAEEAQEEERELAVREGALRDAVRRLDEDDTGRLDADPDAVAAVRESYDSVQAAGSAVSAQRTAVHEQADGLRRREEALRLAGLPLGATVPAAVPSPTAIRESADRLSAAQATVKEAQGSLERAQATLVSTRRQLVAAQSAEVPDPKALEDARCARDASVVELITAWLAGRHPGQAADLRTRVERDMVRADEVADRLVLNAEAVAHLAGLTRQLAQHEADHAASESSVEAAGQAAEQARAAWNLLWQALADSVPNPADASDVRHHLDAARTAQELMMASHSRITELAPQIRSQTAALSAALDRTGRSRPGFDLDSLLETARQLLAEADAARESRAASEQLQRLAEEARQQRDAAAISRAQVLARWKELLRASAVPEDLDAAAWVHRRKLVGDARALQQAADDRHREAAEAAQRNASFVSAVMTLAVRHRVPGDGAASAISGLAARVDAARSARTTAEALDIQITQAENKVAAEQVKVSAALVRLEALRGVAEVRDLEELSRAADRGRSVQRLTADAERLTDLVLAAAPGDDLPALVQELAVTDSEALEASCEDAREEAEAAQDMHADSVVFHAEKVQRERELTTGEGSAGLHARAQEHLETVAEQVERYLVARIQRDILSTELEAYERKHASPLLDEAGLFLERLTGGRYVALGVNDRPSGRSLAVISADEERHHPSQLSEGTADQVFLALRLAGIASLQKEREHSGVPPLPVVLDDVLMAFDDVRAEAALGLMSELAKRWQVIVFSHHTHLADLADSLDLDGLTVSRLMPPPAIEATRGLEEIRVRARVLSVPSVQAAAAAPRSVVRGRGSSESGAIRAWARENGYLVADRGRIQADILAAHELAHR